MATPRTGLPYFWVTWLAKILGGQQCLWRVWFQGHYRYDRYEEQAGDLAQWNRDHSDLMRRRRRELERQGYTVHEEEANAFKLKGEAAIVAGKPDLVAVKPDHVLLVDGKTGRERESDIWQVLIYLFAIPKARKDLRGVLEGEVQYRQGDVRVTVTPDELTPERLEQLVSLIRTVSSDTPPPRVPSRYECRGCNVGPTDCPERVSADRETVLVSEF